jgi:hypothetical protein
MKNALRVSLLAIFSAIAISSMSKPMEVPGNSNTLTPNAAEMKRLENRLAEIRSMDIKTMSRPEKKALKQEVRAIKKTMDSSGGIYISVGAVILIIVLLIVLL